MPNHEEISYIPKKEENKPDDQTYSVNVDDIMLSFQPTRLVQQSWIRLWLRIWI